ncbi:hypothetical protein CEUSTIGMA_g8832.t1 [Chlamydomonas eustigma]|uniref:Uncharacterized protein n=1 Tax=Chlamydomonas eustigma TaxID=1157962 RepID=A0A250XEC2_9CHLO|nr:hypothetical protein CEUSTIGMA_g8832.t1 [Chlamydomonas eustigma]|eukprot:GAX81401.1 hypothetical protein CEUSTIGMA_g8832.t1 [Chlamydomonas eustigma]
MLASLMKAGREESYSDDSSTDSDDDEEYTGAGKFRKPDITNVVRAVDHSSNTLLLPAYVHDQDVPNISFADEYPQRSLLNILDNEGDQRIYVEFHKYFLTYDADTRPYGIST